MKDDYLIQSIDADLTNLYDKINQLEKLLENQGKKIAKQQEIVDQLLEKI
jgi:archaellum component FlaC